MSEETWVLAIVGGRDVVGRLHGTDALEPVYQLQSQIAQGPTGQTAIMRLVFPLGLVSNWRRVPIASDTPMVPLSELASNEREEIMRGVRNAEQLRLAMTAAGAGIVTAGPGVKLPPPPGGR